MASVTRRVLLVDPDVDALGALASALRAHGLMVTNASEPYDAVEVAFQMRPDVVLVAEELDRDNEITEAFRAVPELAETPILSLVQDGSALTLPSDRVLRIDVEHIISRITDASPRDSRQVLPQEIRGTVEQMSLVDLLQLLAMNRRSGILSTTTGGGAGEVRVREGEVVDAVFRRLEGEKALFRLLGERTGHFAFLPGQPDGVRRITAATSMLLMEAMRQVDEVARRRREIAPKDEALLGEESWSRPDDGARTPAAQVARDLSQLLAIPRSVDEILDEIAAPDLAILDALAKMVASKGVRRIPRSELTTPLAPPEQLAVLRSLVTRLTRAGFAPPPRLVIATGVKRMPALAHAVRRITDSAVPADLPPRAGLPRPLGTLRLGDGVELALTGLPADDLFAPTWALALPGAAAVVRLNDAGGAALEAHCQSVEVMLIDGEGLMGAIDVAVPAQVAALVRSALEMAAGV
jgi:CheY-like chemotaxis protein